MTNEIKPCPFCGKEARVHETISWNEGSKKLVGFSIVCGNKPQCCRQPSYYRVKEKAIFVWNGRNQLTK